MKYTCYISIILQDGEYDEDIKYSHNDNFQKYKLNQPITVNTRIGQVRQVDCMVVRNEVLVDPLFNLLIVREI